jgi:hypothetical protein
MDNYYDVLREYFTYSVKTAISGVKNMQDEYEELVKKLQSVSNLQLEDQTNLMILELQISKLKQENEKLKQENEHLLIMLEQQI